MTNTPLDLDENRSQDDFYGALGDGLLKIVRNHRRKGTPAHIPGTIQRGRSGRYPRSSRLATPATCSLPGCNVGPGSTSAGSGDTSCWMDPDFADGAACTCPVRGEHGRQRKTRMCGKTHANEPTGMWWYGALAHLKCCFARAFSKGCMMAHGARLQKSMDGTLLRV